MMARNPSAYVWTALMRVVKVDVDEEYVPVAIEGENCPKKAREVDVTSMEPCASQTMRAS